MKYLMGALIFLLIISPIVIAEEIEDTEPEYIAIPYESVDQLATNDEQLTSAIDQLTVSDEDINSIRKRYDGIIIYNHDQPAKLFSKISLDYNVKVTISENGRIKVEFPWYLPLTKNYSREVKQALDAKVDEQLDLFELNQYQAQHLTLIMLTQVSQEQYQEALLKLE